MDPLQFYKCLSDKTRLRCMLLIHQESELCVCELMQALQEIQPKVSRHLAQLKQCGLLNDRRQGQWVYYRINEKLDDWVSAVLTITAKNNLAFLTDNINNLQKMGNRPDRVRACCKTTEKQD